MSFNLSAAPSPPIAKLLADETLAGAAANFTSIAISSSYNIIKIEVFSLDAAAAHNVGVQFNGDNAANYSCQLVRGNSSTASAVRDSGQTSLIIGSATSIGVPTLSEATIFNFTGIEKQATSKSGAENINATLHVGRWSNTAQITALLVVNQAGNFAIGSRLRIWGYV